jgi:hypothetical protein
MCYSTEYLSNHGERTIEIGIDPWEKLWGPASGLFQYYIFPLGQRLMGKGWNICRVRWWRPGFPKDYLLHASNSNKNNWIYNCPHAVNRWTCRPQTISSTLFFTCWTMDKSFIESGSYIKLSIIYILAWWKTIGIGFDTWKRLWVPSSGLFQY